MIKEKRNARAVGPFPAVDTLVARCRGPKRPSKVVYFGVVCFGRVLGSIWAQFWEGFGPTLAPWAGT